jgi:F5/8 type C domain/NedA-like, galactose-binding domain
MRVTRRALIKTAAAGSAASLLAGVGRTLPASAASPPGDVVGKVTVGYQGWFACIGDGAPINGWWHWSQNWSQPPSPSNNGTLRAWPDMREYTHGYQTAYANLGNGQPATLFSSYDQQTVDTHFRWMQQNSIDTAALQRFNPTGGEGPTRDAMAAKVRSAAETYGRKFYIMYDVTGWTTMQQDIRNDWTGKMSAHTASPAYARQNGKPVVCIWGFGFNDANHPWDPAACLDVVTWFKSQGCYVIGGVPREWRTGVGGSRSGFLGVYHAFNMLSPWMVGAIGTIADSDSVYQNITLPDQADCNANGIDYQPCVLPGDVSARQRAHGDFMWRQFYNMVRAGAQGIYISMYDEFNEGNQILETAESQAWIPTNSGLLGLDEDGTACSSDYYLRLTGDGGRMLKGQIALTPVRPTQPVLNGGDTNLALHRPTSASSTNGGFGAGNATDGDQNSYWESVNGTFPQWLQVDLASAATVGRVVLKLPASWPSRNQTLTISGSLDGSSFSALAAPASYTFTQGANIVIVNVPSTTARYVRVTITANTGWPAAQVSEFEVYGTAGTTPPPNTNLAAGRPTTESSHTQGYVSGNAVDADANTYWESANNAFPQWIQVDLGASTSVSRLVLKLPPSSAWGARTQTLTVSGSTDGASFSAIVNSASYTFDPASGNSVTITFAATTRRYLRLSFTGNTGWPAGQLSDFQAWAS